MNALPISHADHPANRLRIFRDRWGGITQTAAARLFGVSADLWSKWESGQRCPRPYIWRMVSLLERCRAAELLEPTEDPTYMEKEYPVQDQEDGS